ncbi:MAG: hypothetical protein JWM57_729 [Phycisphaerales bacterium]|nr:hypothetical protein [Phycisphaerales bacterium]
MQLRRKSLRLKPSPRPSPGHTGRGGRALALVAVLVSATFSFAAAPAAPSAPPTPAAIDDSIERGRAYLYTLQNPDGTWEEQAIPPTVKPTDTKGTYDDAQWGGRTALAVYTLLSLGERPTSDKLQKAIQFLHTSPINSTYGLAVKLQVWSSLPQTAEVKKSLRRDAAMLLSYKKNTGQNFIVWDYAAPDTTRAKQYTLGYLATAGWGLAAANDVDYEVPPDIWRAVERTLTSSQTADGAWRLKFEADTSKATLAKPLRMYDSANSAATLQIAQDFSRTDAAPRGNVGSPALEKAIDWIAKNYNQEASTDPSVGAENINRRLYGIEQVALATGLRRFGSHDWYAEGSAWFLDKQTKKAGNWGVTSRSGTDYRLIDTCWALLYLQHGRVPLAMAKLDYSDASDNPKKALWNQRPRDAANVVRWIGRSIERELRWQIIDPSDSLEAMLESPVLYLPGGDTLMLKADAKAKLKAYVENGGLIFAVADGGNPAFSKSVERLALDLFPGNEWRDLPDTHPLFASQMYKRQSFKTRPLVRGLSNGVRELVILVPAGDPAKTWQLRGGKTNTDAWQLAANVVSYAVEKTHFYTRGSTWLTPETTKKPTKAITVGRLKYNGKWDAEPQAWPQFIKYAQARDLAVTLKTIEPGDKLDGIDVIYCSGPTAFTLDDATRDTVKAYLDAGGRLIFEAAGGNGAFAASAQAELTRWYGADSIVPLPPTHAIYGDKLAVAFRSFNMASIDKPNEPQFRAIEKNGKAIALLSREDLTAGLLGVNTDGITGYTPESARAVLLRVLTKIK